MRSGFLLHCLTGTLLLSLLIGCGNRDKTQEQVPGKIDVRVEVMEIQPETLHETFVAPGVARAKEEFSLSTQVGGMLTAHYADRGDMVKAGTILFKMDQAEFQLSVRERAANLSRAEANLKFMEQQQKRKKPLFQDGNLSQREWDQFLLDLATAVSEKEQSTIILEKAERDLRLTVISSPINGTILERNHENGKVVPRGTVLARVANISSIIFEVGISDLDLAFIKKGAAVDIKVDAFPDKVYKGTVTHIIGNVDPGKGAFPVEVTTPNSGLEILPGMVGRVFLPGETYTDRLIIPLGAVQRQLGKALVYVVEDGQAVERSVTLEKVLGERVVVKGGIKAGDLLVVVGQGKLVAGDPVKITVNRDQGSGIRNKLMAQ